MFRVVLNRVPMEDVVVISGREEQRTLSQYDQKEVKKFYDSKTEKIRKVNKRKRDMEK